MGLSKNLLSQNSVTGAEQLVLTYTVEGALTVVIDKTAVARMAALFKSWGIDASGWMRIITIPIRIFEEIRRALKQKTATAVSA